MKNLLFTICCFAFVQFSFGQNYYPVNRKDVYYYSDASKSVAFALKIDSVKKIGQDSVYYMYKQIRNRTNSGTNFSCQYTSFGDSWFGNNIKISSDGSCVLLNKNKSEFLIKTKASINESWTAYQNSKWKAQMTVSTKNVETFLGISDSVKTFTIDILKLNGSDTTHPYDGAQFKISKNYGFIKLINIFKWDNAGDYKETILYSLTLGGMDNAKLGLYNFSVKEIYDFSVGDVFQYEDSYTCNCPYKFFTQRIDSIVDKITTDSSFTYNINRRTKKLFYRSSNINPDSTANAQTNVSERYLFKDFKSLTDLKKFDFYFDSKLNLWGKKYSPGLKFQSNNLLDTCLTPMAIDLDSYNYYYKSLGIADDILISYITDNESKSTLVFYKKGNTTWGTRIVLGIENEESTILSSFKIAPNPTKETIHYSISGNFEDGSITLINSSGIEVLKSPIRGNENTIDVRNLTPGLYFYQLSNNSKSIKTGKLIIE